MKNQFEFRLRTQFRFRVTDVTLSHILRRIAQRKVNIDGFLQTKLQRNGKLNLVRMVVGGTESETSRDLRVTREVLNRLGVKFTEKRILQLYGFPSNVPGIINTLFGALWCKAGVQATYLGEQTALYIDAKNLRRAVRVLSQSTLKRCPTPKIGA